MTVMLVLALGLSCWLARQGAVDHGRLVQFAIRL